MDAKLRVVFKWSILQVSEKQNKNIVNKPYLSYRHPTKIYIKWKKNSTVSTREKVLVGQESSIGKN